MASFYISLSLFFTLGLLFLLSSPADSLTCSSQKFDQRNYSHCADLPHLSAFLHWTYDASNSSLAIAFIATPAKPNGWVAWAINPTGTGMVGSQALVAVKSNGSVVVRTFSITSYSSILPSSLSFEVWDLSAENSGGNYTIFATVKVPAMATSVNQVWQVGPGVNEETGLLLQHAITPENLNSTGVLKLTPDSSPSSGPASSSSSPSPSSGSHNSSAPSNGRRIRPISVGIRTGAYLFLAALFVLLV